MSDRLMSTGDVAEVLGVSEATVKRWADAEALACIRTPGGHRKFRLRDIALHLASRRTANAPSGAVLNVDDKELSEVVSALLVGDIEKVSGAIASSRLQRNSIARIADSLLLPAFLRVTEACQDGQCESFHLHIAVNTMGEVVARQRQLLRTPGSQRSRALCAPVPSEPHDIAARLASIVAVEKDLDAFVISTGLAPEGIARAAESLGAAWIVLAGQSRTDDAVLVDYVNRVLGSTQRSRARIVLLGEQVSAVSGLPDDVLLIRDLRDLEGLLAPMALRMVR